MCYLILNGFRYSVEVPQDGAFGNINTTGKLTGLIGMLHRKVALSDHLTAIYLKRTVYHYNKLLRKRI